MIGVGATMDEINFATRASESDINVGKLASESGVSVGPLPVSDPAASGLPETADDDSHPDAERDAGRVVDGWAPAALPAERDGGPAALEDFGTTAAERRRGESLDGRLAREEPDLTPARLHADPDPVLAGDLDPEAADRLGDDSESLADDAPVDPRLSSHVSLYDRPVHGVPAITTVGRLIRPDGDGYSVHEPDEVAFDAGATGGAFSGEEAAMHAMSSDELDAWEGESEPYVSDKAGAAAEDRLPPPYDAGAVRKLVIRTGADQPWDPEDLAVAEGRDPTPANIERARRELEQWGPAAIERTVP